MDANEYTVQVSIQAVGAIIAAVIIGGTSLLVKRIKTKWYHENQKHLTTKEVAFLKEAQQFNPYKTHAGRFLYIMSWMGMFDGHMFAGYAVYSGVAKYSALFGILVLNLGMILVIRRDWKLKYSYMPKFSAILDSCLMLLPLAVSVLFATGWIGVLPFDALEKLARHLP